MNYFFIKPEERKVFPAVGKCIYCGDNTQKLTREHIIPFGLGGNMILPKASCIPCSDITKKFEQKCLRSIYGPLRIKLGIQSRNPEDRPSHVPVTISVPNGTSKLVSMPIEDYPTHLLNFAFGPPGILVGKIPSQNCDYRVSVRVVPEEMAAFNAKYECVGIRGPKNYDVHSFMRMLAKIAHSFVAADIGLDKFDHLAVPLIGGRNKNAPYLVGGDFDIPQPASNHANQIKWTVLKPSKLIVVEIRLLASLGTPQYCAVVGRYKGDPDKIVVRK